MDNGRFKTAYGKSRNGANEFIKYLGLIVSDGVVDCADAGCWWLVDIIATECRGLENLLVIKAVAANGKADLTGIGSGDKIRWSRHIDFTDMPDGEWLFYLQDNVLILPTEY